MFFLWVALSVFLVHIVACASIFEGHNPMTNAERFRRGLPPLPPRHLVSGRKRHVHPTRPRGAPCPTNVSPPICPGPGPCGYIAVTDTNSNNLGYVYTDNSLTPYFGVTSCTVNAAFFDFPASSAGSPFRIAQNTPLDPNLPYIGTTGTSWDVTQAANVPYALFVTSVGPDTTGDAGNPQPNAQSALSTDPGESTVWTTSGLELLLQWTNYDDQSTIAMGIIFDQTDNCLVVTADPTDWLASPSGQTTDSVRVILTAVIV